MITEPKTPRHTEAAAWRSLHQGALDSGLGRKGLGSLEGCFVGRAGGDLVRNPPFYSLTQSLSWAHCPGGGGRRGLHSRESGWPGTSSLAVQTASPGPSAAHPAKTGETEGSATRVQKTAALDGALPKGNSLSHPLSHEMVTYYTPGTPGMAAGSIGAAQPYGT